MASAGILYFVSLALFGFVIFAAAQMPSGWLVACILPVFLAAMIGFFMFVFAWAEFGAVLCVGSLVLPFVVMQLLRRSLSSRGMFIAICGTTVVGLVCARFAFWAADVG